MANDRLVDLSVLVENTPSEPMTIRINRLDHKKGARVFSRRMAWNKRLPLKQRLRHFIKHVFGKERLVASDFPGSSFLSLDEVTLPSHMGTHIDAPFHYGPDKSGNLGCTVDQLDINWFYKPGVVLDLTHKLPGEYISKQDIQDALVKTGHLLKPLDIVLIRTDCDKLWGKSEYFSKACGMGREGTEWLISQGIQVIGIDTYGFDRPFPVMLREFWKTGDKSHLWPAHFVGRDMPYVQIERLANLDKLPPTGFKVICLPLRIKGLDASWVRAVAIIDS